MTEFGDKLAEALKNKEDDITTYIWKGPKINDSQEEIRLIDADYDQLHRFYKHCQQMLYNTDEKNPGRYTLIKIIDKQIQCCRAELLVRWLRSEKGYDKTNCFEDIKTVINNNKEVLSHEALKTYPIGQLINGLPIDFARVPVDLLMTACLDYLGVFNNSYLSLNFIVKLGLWFTPQELNQELYRKDPETGKAMNRLSVVMKELRLDPNINLKICGTGLSYAEFKAMYRLRKNDKYSNLTSEQLRLLSEKILYKFQERCEAQAKQWEDKIEEILKVAKHKGWDVTRDID